MIVSCGMAIASTLALSIVLVVCYRLACWLLRTSLPIALPLAFCLLVTLETALLNGLGAFRSITPGTLLASHALLGGLGLVVAARRGQTLRWLHPRRLWRLVRFGIRSPAAPYLLPMILLLYGVALIYPPNNYDSLTYHMARVSFWVQNQSVDFYRTINPRQNGLGPGAEYLILVLQELSGGDRFANCVQTTAYVLLVVSVALTARYLRAPRALLVPLVLVFATAPGFVLEATTTQNDLCAALGALAISSALRRQLFGRKPSFRQRDALALAVAVAGSYLVKPNVLLLATPLVAVAAARVAMALCRDQDSWRSSLRALATAPVLSLVLAGPHLIRTVQHPDMLGPVSNLVFPLNTAELTLHRLLNPLFAVTHHLPIRELDRTLEGLFDRVSQQTISASDPWWVDGYYTGHVLRQYEDLAGAPIQFVAVFLLAGVGGVWAARQSGRARRVALMAALLPLASWAFFHWIARNNLWIARYHTPWLALGIIAAFGACQWARSGRTPLTVLSVIGWAAAVPSLLYAWSTIMCNELRPVSSEALLRFDRIQAYYAHAPELRQEHDQVLDELSRGSCRTLVIALGNHDEIEYPLTWRAQELGAKVYHRPGPADACLLYARHPFRSAAWQPLRPGETKLFVPVSH